MSSMLRWQAGARGAQRAALSGRRGRWSAAWLALLAVGLGGQGRAAARPGGFTAAERRALSAGELVVRETTHRRGDAELIGGSSWQVIDAPPAVVFKALQDTQYYHRMLPAVSAARVVNQMSKGRRTVYFQHAAGPVEVSYFVTLRSDPERREVRFSLDRTRPHDLRAAWGFYSVRPYRDGRTLLAYGVLADMGGGLLRVLVRDSVHEWMLKAPWTIKRFVEGSGRYIYGYDVPGDESPAPETNAAAASRGVSTSGVSTGTATAAR